MQRKEFLSLLGLTASSAVFSCLCGCSKSNMSGSSSAPSSVDFTLDLSQTANSQLNNNGGYIYANGILVARTLSGQYIAVQQICTHQNFTIVYQAAYHRFYCDGHGGTFSESGQVTGGPPPSSLRTYNTSLSGNMLRVYS